MKESSVGADREKLYRERKKAVAEMAEEPSADNLWNAIVAFQGYPFKTSKGLSFTYKVKGGELFFTRKEKSITKQGTKAVLTSPDENPFGKPVYVRGVLYLDDVPEDDSANDAGDSSVDKPGDADKEMHQSIM